MVAQARVRLEADELGEALQLYGRAVELAPTDQELAEEYGIALAESGQVEQALAQFARVERPSTTGHATIGILLAQTADNPEQLARAVGHLEAALDASSQGGAVRLTLVQSLLRLGRGEAAAQALQPLLEERPDDVRLQLLAGQALRQMGKLDEAAEQFRAAAARPEGRQRATLELVETLSAAEKYREAADVLGGFLETEGKTLAGLTRWATLLVRADDRAKAGEVLDDVLSRDPDFRDALLVKAMLESRDGRPEAAEQLYRRALAASPADADAAMGLARLLVDLRRLDEARSLIDGVWRQLADEPAAADPARVEVAQERATVELIDRKLDAARPWLDRLTGVPLSRRSLALWIEYFRQREAFQEGLDFLARVKVASDPASSRMLAGFTTELKLAVGDEAGARAALDPLLAGDEDDVTAGLGALERRKRYRESAASARAALDRLKDAPDVEFILAASLERMGSWDEAVPVFRRLIEGHPDNPTSLNYLGYMFADKGVNLEEALGLIQKAVKLDPTSGAYLDSLGWVHFRLGNLDLAEKHLTEAARLEPYDATVHEHLGDLFAARGDRSRAEQAYRRAVANEPDEPGQKERIEEKLGKLAGAPAR
ncbi:MAG: tetratricopeptide repeat protein [Acidobacteria bacterium]|nr:tetratricopeptide repeat protein [Acidobacteriota bacterium]